MKPAMLKLLDSILQVCVGFELLDTSRNAITNDTRTTLVASFQGAPGQSYTSPCAVSRDRSQDSQFSFSSGTGSIDSDADSEESSDSDTSDSESSSSDIGAAASESESSVSPCSSPSPAARTHEQDQEAVVDCLPQFLFPSLPLLDRLSRLGKAWTLDERLRRYSFELLG